MSLEAKIEALIAAVEANTAALQDRATVSAPEASPPADKPNKVAPAKVAPVKATTAKAAATPPAEVSYDEVKVSFLALVKHNRDTALAVLKPFGLDSLKAAKPEQYGAILEAVNEVKW